MWLTLAVFAVFEGSNPSSCKDVQMGGNTTDGLYVLHLDVDAVNITSNDFTVGTGLELSWPSVDQPGIDNFVTKATKMTTPVHVYCHKMDSLALAYLEVNETNNYAMWASGNNQYKTSFRKLRFDESTQLLYTADYTFATASTTSEATYLMPHVCEGVRPMVEAFQDVPGIENIADSLCYGGELYVPFGTVHSESTDNTWGAGMKMDFGEHETMKTYSELLKREAWPKVDHLSDVPYYSTFDRRQTAGKTLIYTQTSMGWFGGVEVGNAQKYYDVINYNGATMDQIKPFSNYPEMNRSAEGGWGIPLCMTEVPDECPNRTCKVAVNCINHKMISPNSLFYGQGYTHLARTRPLEFGAQRHLEPLVEIEIEEDSTLGDGAVAGIAVGGVVVVAGVGAYTATLMGGSSAAYSSVLNFV